MSKTYKLEIITPENIFHEGDVVYTNIPAEKGYLGILVNHAALVSTCIPGELYYREEDGKEYRYQIEKGFVEIRNNHVKLLTQSVREITKT